MSNRDRFLLLIIGIAGVILLPYFLYIQTAKEEIVNFDNQIVQLNNRLEQLKRYEVHRDEFEEGTEWLNNERDELMALFPSQIDPANYTMYLLNTEYSEFVEYTNLPLTEDGEVDYEAEIDYEPVIVVEPTIRFNDVTYTNNVRTPISGGGQQADGSDAPIIETEYTAVQNFSTVNFQLMDYDTMFHLLDYIMEYEDPMIYKEINFNYNKTNGSIEGQMLLAQYAVEGNGRDFEPIEILPDIDKLEMRGNEDYGVFGPDLHTLQAEYQQMLEDEENGITHDEDEDDEEDED